MLLTYALYWVKKKNMQLKEKIGPKLKKPLRLPEQVATCLVFKIKEGAFQPGEKLPSEAVLAEQFGFRAARLLEKPLRA